MLKGDNDINKNKVKHLNISESALYKYFFN
jgi:hypothetical protein